MSTVNSSNKQMVLHPIMFAVYPVAFLFVANQSIFDFSITYIPVLVTTAFAGAIWLLFTRWLKDVKRAAVMTSAIVMGTFSFGALQQFLAALGSDDGITPFWTTAVAACCLAVVLCTAFAMKWREQIHNVTYVLNLVGLFLVFSPLFQAGMGGLAALTEREMLPDRTEFNQNPLANAGPVDGPDIYYFILDGYGRADVLEEDFGFDNSAFLSGLRDRGFKIAEEAISNYPVTIMSATSTMNFAYLDEPLGRQLNESQDRRFLRELMRESRAVRLLKSAGYKIVSFEGEYQEARIGSTDTRVQEWWFLNSFNIGLLQMTPVAAVFSALDLPVAYELHRTRTQYPFEQMENVSGMAGPKLVYTHIYFAHPPFVFGPSGERRASALEYTWDDGSRLLDEDGSDRQGYINGYTDQVTYLNGKVLEAIDTILKNSEREPIIIMHGDHGPGLRYSVDSLEHTNVRERYSIFYAAHLPDGGNEFVYDSLSPVNGFRIVFNKYFGTNYPLLPDESYFSPFTYPYDYARIEGFPPQAAEPQLSADASATAR
jgi:hypothetical protein